MQGCLTVGFLPSNTTDIDFHSQPESPGFRKLNPGYLLAEIAMVGGAHLPGARVFSDAVPCVVRSRSGETGECLKAVDIVFPPLIFKYSSLLLALTRCEC